MYWFLKIVPVVQRTNALTLSLFDLVRVCQFGLIFQNAGLCQHRTTFSSKSRCKPVNAPLDWYLGSFFCSTGVHSAASGCCCIHVIARPGVPLYLPFLILCDPCPIGVSFAEMNKVSQINSSGYADICGKIVPLNRN